MKDANTHKDFSKVMSGDKFDPELLQIRWVLGGLRPEELPDQATLALEQGFDGTALRQLAGLVRPTLRELETLPNRAFAEMGLPMIDKQQAATSLVARGLPHTGVAMSVLLKAFPGFSERWQQHVTNWSGEPAGSYNDIDQFVYFVVDDLYDKGKLDEVRRVFTVLEELLTNPDQETKNLLALGFFEGLQNHASRRPHGSKVFEEFMGPNSRDMWKGLQNAWFGETT